MKKYLVFLPLVAVLLAGCNGGGNRRRSGGGGSDQPTPSPDDPEGYEYYSYRYRNKKDCFGNPVDDYHFYDTYGEDLVDQIHDYCVDAHKTYLNYYKQNYHTLFEECDKYFDDDGNPQNKRIRLFYTGTNASAGSGNREHVWACANSNGYWKRNSSGDNPYYDHQIDEGHDYWGGGSDIFNLHACNGAVNTARGNASFTTFVDSTGYTEATDNIGPYKIIVSPNGKKAEPDIHYRGDVARIVLYMWAHYSLRGTRNVYYPENYASLKPVYDINQAVKPSGTRNPNMCCATLSLSLIMGFNSNEETYAALKKWNEEDPPDAMEKHANDYIEQKVQGNRNPFIDYPQLVDNVVDHLD